MERNLPTLAELHHSPAEAFRADQLNLLLNQPPHASWIKKHPLAKAKNAAGQSVPAEYLPIDKVEYLLTRIFQEWRVEVLQAVPMFQSITVTVRLHYRNPLTGEWSYHDGVGAKSVQVNSGASAADLGQIKDAGVQMALPAAKSYAIKDAAEHLGTLFGKDLNRVGTVSFRPTYEEPEEPEIKTTEPPVTTYVKQEEPMPLLASVGIPCQPKEEQLNYFQSIGRGITKVEETPRQAMANKAPEPATTNEDDFEL